MKSFAGVRKKWIVFMVCILTICMIVPAYAAEDLTDGSLLAGYVLDDQLYAFFEAEEPTGAGLIIGDVMRAEGYTEALVESDQYVHYYILLDASGSMKNSRNLIKKFVMELMGETRTKKLVTIMTLGEAFDEVISASMEDDAVEKALDSISYSDQRTNLYKGIDSAVRFIDEKKTTRGDLYRLILVTDGEPDGVTEQPSPEDVKRQVEARTDIVFDVIGTGNWKKGSEEDLPMSGREVNVVSSLRQAGNAAAKLAAETNSLYTVCFGLENPVQDRSLDIKIFLKGSENRILEQQDLTIAGKATVPAAAGDSPKDLESDNTQDGQEQGSHIAEEETGQGSHIAEEETGQEQGWDGAEGGQEQELAGSDTQSGQEQTSDRVEQEIETGTGNESNKAINLPVYGGILLGIIVLCVIVILLLRKLLHGKDQIAPGHLRMEVLSGQYVSRKKDFLLEHTLLIGSGAKCDMVWKEEDVSIQNTRIFVHEGIVCIEDLNSLCGTMIGGMRIFAPNRLRSGDIVCIGKNVQFRVFFNQN